MHKSFETFSREYTEKRRAHGAPDETDATLQIHYINYLEAVKLAGRDLGVKVEKKGDSLKTIFVPIENKA